VRALDRPLHGLVRGVRGRLPLRMMTGRELPTAVRDSFGEVSDGR